MASIVVMLLSSLEVSVQGPEFHHVGPAWDELLGNMWDRCVDVSTHQQLGWAQFAPMQKGCSLAQQRTVGILRLPQQLLHSLHCSLCHAVALWEARTARDMREVVLI